MLVSVGQDRAAEPARAAAAHRDRAQRLAVAARSAGLLRSLTDLGEPQHVGPDPAAIDAVLDRLDGHRLVIDADLPGVQLVLHRLMRAGLLDVIDTAVLLRGSVPYLSTLGLPSSLDQQVAVAVAGTPRLVGVVKDDSGGLCIDHAAVVPWQTRVRGPENAAANGADRVPPSRWWLRAVVDDQRLCDGPARSVRLRRIAPDELEATVRLGRLRKRRLRGRSLQLACDESLVSQDGLERDRPRSKRTFWSEPLLWKLALGAS